MKLTLADDQRRPELTIVVSIPPPHDGMSIANLAMSNALSASGETETVLYGASPHRSRLFNSALKHLTFLVGIAKARSQRLYFVPDAQKGLLLNVVEAVLMRMKFKVVWLHHHVYSYINVHDWRMSIILKLLGDRARHIVLSRAMGEDLAKQYPVAEFQVLNNSMFLSETPEYRQRRKVACIGFLSNISREKGIDLFVKTMKRLEGSLIGAKCLIAGPIVDPELRAEIEAFCRERPENRTWLGPVYGDQKLQFLDDIDILFFPSQYRNEAQPITIYEALSAGVPVISTDIGCIKEQLDEYDWVFPSRRFSAAAHDLALEWHNHPAILMEASEQAWLCYESQRKAASLSLKALQTRLTQHSLSETGQ